jgi:hypothetical protein
VPHPFYRPLHAADSPEDFARIPQQSAGTVCTCPGWCEGRASRHWLTCQSSCPACNPKRRRRGVQDDPGSRFYQGSEDPGSSLDTPPDQEVAP